MTRSLTEAGRCIFCRDRDMALAGADMWGKARTTPPLQGWKCRNSWEKEAQESKIFLLFLHAKMKKVFVSQSEVTVSDALLSWTGDPGSSYYSNLQNVFKVLQRSCGVCLCFFFVLLMTVYKRSSEMDVRCMKLLSSLSRESWSHLTYLHSMYVYMVASGGQ